MSELSKMISNLSNAGKIEQEYKDRLRSAESERDKCFDLWLPSLTDVEEASYEFHKYIYDGGLWKENLGWNLHDFKNPKRATIVAKMLAVTMGNPDLWKIPGTFKTGMGSHNLTVKFTGSTVEVMGSIEVLALISGPAIVNDWPAEARDALRFAIFQKSQLARRQMKQLAQEVAQDESLMNYFGL